MTAFDWLLRIPFASAWIGTLLWLGYNVIFPMVARFGYRRGGITSEAFKLQGGEEEAGSEDAVYYAATFDCRGNNVMKLTGPPPDAVYWMIGIYDDRVRRLRGGHVNGETITVGEDGNYHLTIQPLPGPVGATLECGRVRRGLILMRVFLPKDRSAVVPPRIERVLFK